MMNNCNKLINSLVLVVAILLVGYVIALSQEEFLMKNGLNWDVAEVEMILFSNLLFFHQLGNEHVLVSVQEQQGETSNNVISFQNGLNNSAYIQQAGSGLDTRIEQHNVSNEANIWSIGINIQTTVKQIGDGNKINSYIENSGNVFRSASLLQEGNFNKIELSLIGDGFTDHSLEQSVSISQYGNRHEVKAFMEPFYNPLEITQTPGTNGEGMKIDVSTSTFSFPTK
jgi:hypothetical protein